MATTENLTILFTDIVGFSERTSTQTRVQNESMLHDHDSLLRPLIKQFSGRYIKSIGDAMLITFRSATNGLHCAMAMHDALFEFNKNRPAHKAIIIRAALDTGDIRIEDGDIFGEAVNTAARLENITPPAEIYFTETVYLSMNRAEVQSEHVGGSSFKGIPDKINIYRALPQHQDNTLCPFGGMHLDSTHAAQSLRQLTGAVEVLQKPSALRTVFGVSIAIILILLVANFNTTKEVAPAPPPTIIEVKRIQPPPIIEAQPPKKKRDFIADGERLLEEDRLEAAEQIYRDALADDPRSATSLLLEGHIAFAKSKREKGLSAYTQALELNTEFKTNTRLIDHLVDALGRTTKPAQLLLEKYRSDEMLKALSARTSQPLYWGRHHAINLLTNVKRTDLIRANEAALLDFKEADTCERRKDAVIWLGKLKNKKALPLLEPIANANFFDRLTDDNKCLTDEAKNSVAQIIGEPIVVDKSQQFISKESIKGKPSKEVAHKKEDKPKASAGTTDILDF